MNGRVQRFRVIFGGLECAFALACLCLVRLGGYEQEPLVIADRDGLIPVANYNSNAVLIFAAYGNFAILSIQLLGSLAGDRSSLGVRYFQHLL